MIGLRSNLISLTPYDHNIITTPNVKEIITTIAIDTRTSLASTIYHPLFTVLLCLTMQPLA
ncbi:hypothetical protein EV586_101567 [Tumebacillus sp. BK434]|nr:hypothetical protein EV586_101567 [Tumebacillus sp. BK434]